MKHGCLGVFLAVLFVIFFIVSFVLFNVKSTFLNENFWKSSLNNSGIYEKLPQVLENYFSESQGDVETDEQFGDFIKKSITPGWLKLESEKNIDRIFTWLRGDSKALKLEIDMIGFKDDLENALEKEYNALPECTPKQLQKAEVGEMTLDCRIPDKDFDEILDEFFSETGDKSPQAEQNITPEIEDKYVIEKFGPKYVYKDETERIISKSPTVFKNFNYIMYGFMALTVLMLIFIVILARESLRSVFRWVGIPLMIATFGFLLVSLFGKIIINLVSKNLETSTDADPIINEIVSPLLTSLFSELSSSILVQSGIIFGLGAVLLILSFFFGKTEKTAVEQK